MTEIRNTTKLFFESMENHQLGDLDVDRWDDSNETGLWDSWCECACWIHLAHNRM